MIDVSFLIFPDLGTLCETNALLTFLSHNRTHPRSQDLSSAISCVEQSGLDHPQRGYNRKKSCPRCLVSEETSDAAGSTWRKARLNSPLLRPPRLLSLTQDPHRLSWTWTAPSPPSALVMTRMAPTRMATLKSTQAPSHAGPAHQHGYHRA
jgi:hypothetical protein